LEEKGMSNDPAARSAGEGLEAYIARLESIDRNGLSEDEQSALELSLRMAHKRLRCSCLPADAPRASALEWCKQAIRALATNERDRLLGWLVGGMPD
jgi:hypothetical protein